MNWNAETRNRLKKHRFRLNKMDKVLKESVLAGKNTRILAGQLNSVAQALKTVQF